MTAYKNFTALTLIAILIFAQIGLSFANDAFFQQEKNNYQYSTWASEYVDLAIKHNIIPQNIDTDLRKNASRAEVADMLARLVMNKIEVDLSDFNLGGYFIDTDTLDSDIENKISYLNFKGIVTGYNGLFFPDRDISRQEFAIMIVKTLHVLEVEENRTEKYLKPILNRVVSTDFEYTDSWAANYVNLAFSNNLISGSNGKINPKANITREQVLTILAKAIDDTEKEPVKNTGFMEFNNIYEAIEYSTTPKIRIQAK